MLRLLLAGVFGVGATLLVVSQGTFVYGPLQYQLPFRSALKVTPDPANIWSWHGRVTTTSAPTRFPIIVDIDGNGRSDTENQNWRIMVTDIQVPAGSRRRLYLSDGTTRRWLLTPSDDLRDSFEYHFATPIVFPVGSTLTLEDDVAVDCEVHIIGRIVTL